MTKDANSTAKRRHRPATISAGGQDEIAARHDNQGMFNSTQPGSDDDQASPTCPLPARAVRDGEPQPCSEPDRNFPKSAP